MKNILSRIILITAWTAAQCAYGLGENPTMPVSGQTHGAGGLTVPPSSIGGNATSPASGNSSGLVSKPADSYGNEGNMTVTGNVGGGRHFRGVVPYGSAYESGAYLDDEGATSVSEFLRYSSNPFNFESGVTRSTPYYEGTRSVTTSAKGAPATSLPGRVSTEATWKQKLELPQIPKTENKLQVQETRPLDTDTDPFKNNLLKEIRKLQKAKESEEYLDKDIYEPLKVEPLEKPEAEQIQKPEKLIEPQEPDTPKEPVMPGDQQQEKTTQDMGKSEDVMSERMRLFQSLEKGQEKKDEEGQPLQKDDEEKSGASLQYDNPYAPRIPEGPEIPEVDPKLAAAIRGEHKTFAALAAAKTQEHISQAEKHMKEGQYYKAADSYILASVWDPENPKVWAGRGYALFAAGEYMSSSYFIEKAIGNWPEYAKVKVNISELMGDRDVFESRMLELGELLVKSGAGELSFLMAYMLYEEDKVAAARETIGTAVQKMPDSKAVQTLAKILQPDSSKGEQGR